LVSKYITSKDFYSWLIGDIYCVDDQDKIEHQKERLRLAIDRVKEFNTIASVFNNFNYYQTMIDNGQDLPSNVVFNLISSNNFNAPSHQSNSVNNIGTYNDIKDLEDALNH